MILTPNLRIIVVDDHRSLRQSVLHLLARSYGNDPVVSTDDSLSRAPSSENSAVKSDLLADAVLTRLIDSAPNKSSHLYADALIEEMTTGERDETPATLLLIHLNLKTKNSGRRLNHQGLSLYEAVLSRLPDSSPGNSQRIPPVLFYTIDSHKTLVDDGKSKELSSWNRLEQLACSTSLKLDDIVWRVPAAEASQVLEKAIGFWNNAWQNKKSWSTYQTSVLRATIECMNAGTRHSFSGGRRPPVRVLLGALQSGHIQWKETHAVLQAFCDSEPDTQKSIARAAVAAYRHDVIENYKKIVAAKHKAVALPPNRSYLLIDDQVTAVEHCWKEGMVWLKDDSGRRKLTVDQTDNGWGAALACLTRGSVVCANSPNDLHLMIRTEAGNRKGMKRAFRNWDAVFLDYDFQSTHNGGRYLRKIKDIQFDLPVVMLTGLDDSHAAKWCLSHGATAYFVKEGLESEGRDSLSAYRNLRCILDSLPSYEERRRRLWRAFVKLERLIESIEETVYANHVAASANVTPAPAPAIAWNLKQAFYWLFLSQRGDGGKTRPRRPVAPRVVDPNEAECAAGISTHSHSAIEHLIGSLWLLRNGQAGTIESWFDRCKKESVRGIRGMLSFAGLNRPELRLVNLQQTSGDSHCSEPRLDLAKRCLDDVLYNFRILLHAQRTQVNFVKQKRLAALNGPTPDWRRLIEKPIGHAETAELGARGLVSGWAQLVYPSKANEIMVAWSQSPLAAEQFVEKLSANPSAPRSTLGKRWHAGMRNAFRLLLIDDDFDRTGWDSALRIVCGPDSLSDSCKLPDLDRKTPGELNSGVDLILLDLRMPEPGQLTISPEVGIKTLARLREMSRAIPVVMLTATDDAFWTSQALQNGAANYFLKRYQGSEQNRAVLNFLGLVFKLSSLMGWAKPARQVWSDIVDLKKLKTQQSIDWATLQKFYLNPQIVGCSACDWVNGIVTRRMDSLYDHFARTLSVRFRENSRIDVDAWLLEGLHQPRYRRAAPQSTPHALLLALKCGQLVECLALLTMAYKFPSDSSNRSTGQIINDLYAKLSTSGTLPSFLMNASIIWEERNDAAHGYFRKGMNALAVKNPEMTVRRTIDCTRDWLHFLGWQ